MIANFTSGPEFGGLARYLLGYTDKKTDKQAAVLGSAGVRTDTLAHLIADFELGKMLHPELGLAVLHISLSFNPDDAARMTDQKMRQVAEDYVEEMGLKGTQYLLVRHRDRPHEHLHIMANRVADNGHTIGDSNNFWQSEQVIAKLIVRHELSPATENRPHLQNPKRLRGGDLGKYEMRTALRQELATETQRPTLLANLQAKGIMPREFLDKDGNVTGISFKKGGYACKGSALGPEFSSVGIDKQLAANQQKALEVAGQRNESSPEAGAGVTARAADQEPIPAAAPGLGPVRELAGAVAGSLIQPSAGAAETSPSAVSAQVTVPVASEPAVGVSLPTTPEKQGGVSGQQAPLAAAPPVLTVPVEVPSEAKAGGVVPVPAAVPVLHTGPASPGPLLVAEQTAAGAMLPGTPVPKPAEAPVPPPPPEVAEAAPIGTLAFVPSVARPGEQPPAAAGPNTERKSLGANDPVPPVPAVVPLISAATPPTAHSAATVPFDVALASGGAPQLAVPVAPPQEGQGKGQRVVPASVAVQPPAVGAAGLPVGLQEVAEPPAGRSPLARVGPADPAVVAPPAEVVARPPLPPPAAPEVPSQEEELRKVEQQQAVTLALAGMEQELGRIAALKREAIQAERKEDFTGVVKLLYGLIPEAQQRLSLLQEQANATPAGRELAEEMCAREQQRLAAQSLVDNAKETADAARTNEQRHADAAMAAWQKAEQQVREYRAQIELANEGRDFLQAASVRSLKLPDSEREVQRCEAALRATPGAEAYVEQVESYKKDQLGRVRAAYERRQLDELDRFRRQWPYAGTHIRLQVPEEYLFTVIGATRQHNHIDYDKQYHDNKTSSPRVVGGKVAVNILYKPDENDAKLDDALREFRKNGVEVFEHPADRTKREERATNARAFERQYAEKMSRGDASVGKDIPPLPQIEM